MLFLLGPELHQTLRFPSLDVSVRLRADYLVDIALVFALLSFLSVVVAFQLVMSRQKNKRREEKQEGTAHD